MVTQAVPFQRFSGFATHCEPLQTFTGFATNALPVHALTLPPEGAGLRITVAAPQASLVVLFELT